MRTIYFMQVDWLMGKLQVRAMGLFFIIALVLSLGQGNPYWGPLYILFGGMVVAANPFCVKQKSNNGFLLLLPATRNERIGGRFAYGAFLLVLSLVLGGAVMLIVTIVNHIQLQLLGAFYMGTLAAALIFLSIQYTILYIVGEWKSQEVIGLVRTVPGFVLFFGGSFLLGFIKDYQEAGNGMLPGWVIWIFHHLTICAFGGLLVGILIYWLGFFISVQITKKRDFA